MASGTKWKQRKRKRKRKKREGSKATYQKKKKKKNKEKRRERERERERVLVGRGEMPTKETRAIHQKMELATLRLSEWSITSNKVERDEDGGRRDTTRSSSQSQS